MTDYINKLITPEIYNKLNLDLLDIDLELTATDCRNNWPSCRVSLNETEIYNGLVVGNQQITFKERITGGSQILKISYYGKTDRDTIAGSDGNIIANQSLKISKLKLNSVDIIANSFIYRATYKMQLSQQKQEFFKQKGIDAVNNNYEFYENGTWELDFKVPVLSFLIECISHREAYENINYESIIYKIIDKLEENHDYD